MHNEIIRNVREKPALSLAEKLKDQFKETFDLIIHHEWMTDFLNCNLSLEQFESLISQEAYIYNELAKHVLKFEINDFKDNQDVITKIGVYLYSEASENLKILDEKYPLSCFTKNYAEKLENIWEKNAVPHKILSILVQLWIREGIYQLLVSEGAYSHNYRVWSERVTNNSPHELINSLSRILNQSFLKAYGHDEEIHLYQKGFKELEHLLFRFIQFELAIRNHAYHINFNQFQQSKQS